MFQIHGHNKQTCFQFYAENAKKKPQEFQGPKFNPQLLSVLGNN